MPADLITYDTKVNISTPSGAANEIWVAVDENEIKSVVNSHATDIDNSELLTLIANRQSIKTIDTVVTGKTLNNNDYAKIFRCNNSSQFNFLIDNTNAIPDLSGIYFERIDGVVNIEFSGVTHYGIEYSTNNYQIELIGGVAFVLKVDASNYVIWGNLKLP